MLFEERLEIPEPASISGWKEVPIIESGETLIRLNDVYPRIEVGAEYFRQGILGASSLQYLRLGATERLIQAASMLPNEFKLVIFDAFRPLSVQEALFNDQLQRLREQHPSLTEDQLIDETQRYISLPSSSPTRPSPHVTGGAVDVSIVGRGGILLDMGTPFDYFGPEAQTAYFRNRSNWEDIHNNRRLLYTIMTKVGFTNYFEEWWHFDFGNQFWGKVTGQPAIYGLAYLKSLSGGIPEYITVSNSESVIYSIKADSPIETFSPRFGLAGNPDQLDATLKDLSNLHHSNFAIKQQLAEVIIRRHGVHKFAW